MENLMNDRKLIIGIDPGAVSGAVAALWADNREFFATDDMPTMVSGKHNMINPAALADLLQGYWGSSPDGIEMVYVERVSSMPGQGIASTFGFGVSFGIIQGVIAALQFPMTLVTPQAWKKRAGLLGKEKDEARTLMQRLYPKAPLSLKKHVGRADAIAIARFGGDAK
jgi:crossover junction endodeoxyribonuclease RuvC